MNPFVLQTPASAGLARRPSARWILLWCALLTLLGGGMGSTPPARAQDTTGSQELGPAEDPAENPRLQEAFAAALERAQSWSDGVEVDAVALQAHEPPVKGKKKLAEMLDLQLLFHRRANEEGRAAILARVRGLVGQVRTGAYQDMLECPEEEFEANSLSYLRVYVLMDEFGLLEDLDREQMRAAQPRLDTAMEERGAWQRAMFADYYDHLGLQKPAALEDTALTGGIVEQRVPLAEFDLGSAYSLTHEVFVAYDYGQRLDQEIFDDEDLMYLRVILLPLQRLAVAKKGFDLMGEVVSCNTYLGNTEDPSYPTAVELMLSGQNENGSWGDYEAHRPTFGDALEAHAYLHTTLVCVAALVDVFDRKHP